MLSLAPARAAEAPLQVERALRALGPEDFILRPNRLYRKTIYVAGSARCGVFPGSDGDRLACTIRVRSQVDTCPGEPQIWDEITFRIIFGKGEILTALSDGGDLSWDSACEW